MFVSKSNWPKTWPAESILSNDHNTMYSISASGITVLPVGNLNKYPRLTASAQDVAFRGNFCNRNSLTQTFTISDPGGNHTRFAVTPNMAGVAGFARQRHHAGGDHCRDRPQLLRGSDRNRAQQPDRLLA